MMDGKLTFGLALAFVIAMVTMSSAGQLECTFRPSCQRGEVNVMRYYPNTNLAGLPGGAPQRLCCQAPFMLDYRCSGTIDQYTALVRLSAVRNALAEQESMTPAYRLNRRVCLRSTDENIAVMYRAINRDWEEGEFCPDGYKCISSLSDSRAANVAPCVGDPQYPIKICATEYTSDVCVPLIVGIRLLVGGGSYQILIYNACCGVSDYICPEKFEVGGVPVVCPAPNDPDCFEVCDDGVDNDGDGKQDCEDEDCCGHPVCWRYYQSNGLQESAFDKLCCDDGWDNDGDGLVDGDDPSCRTEVPDVNCNNTLDDDWDGLTDCDDPDCCNDTQCIADYFGANESAAGPNGEPAICCSNGLDEDSDGEIDWDDTDCRYEGPDDGTVGTCRDGIDNDNNGRTDCGDPKCCTYPYCADYFGPTAPDGEGGSGPAALGGSRFMCCYNGADEDDDGLADSRDLDCAGAEIYNGEFEDMVKTGERYIFDVRFTDRSFASGDTVTWNFSVDDQRDYAGSCIITESISVQDVEIPLNDYNKHSVLDLALMTTPDNYCAATIHAFAPDGTEVNGSYMLDAGSLPPIDPNAQIPEIPSVIHPVDIYSSDPEDAQAAYNLAEGVVAALLADCGTDCGGNAAAKAKLDDAWRHLKAAERYLAGCKDNQPPLCRFSQYYSERANQLAREGQDIL